MTAGLFLRRSPGMSKNTIQNHSSFWNPLEILFKSFIKSLLIFRKISCFLCFVFYYFVNCSAHDIEPLFSALEIEIRFLNFCCCPGQIWSRVKKPNSYVSAFKKSQDKKICWVQNCFLIPNKTKRTTWLKMHFVFSFKRWKKVFFFYVTHHRHNHGPARTRAVKMCVCGYKGDE